MLKNRGVESVEEGESVVNKIKSSSKSFDGIFGSVSMRLYYLGILSYFIVGCSEVSSSQRHDNYIPVYKEELPRPIKIPKYDDKYNDKFYDKKDPYYRMLSPEQAKEEEREYSQYSDGFGLELVLENNRVSIGSIEKGSLASKTGLKVGDVILKIDGNIITKNTDISEIIWKKKKITVQVLRNKKKINISIHRSKIFEPSIDTQTFKEGFVYVKFKKFNDRSAEEFINNKEIKKSRGVIIDLRGNGGGKTIPAIGLSNLFLKKGSIVCYLKEIETGKIIGFTTSEDGVFSDKSVVILIDHSSASSSEILTMALKDNKRCVVIGSRSYGKGVGQSTIKKNDGSTEIKTSFEWYTPSGRNINNTGIIPDIQGNSLDDAIEVMKRLLEKRSGKKKVKI